MNWMQTLYQTYENCQNSIGYSTAAQRPLIPICHITTEAHIEVVIDGKGNFRNARLVERNDSTTIIPATETSASRSGNKPEGHPLSDKLQYLAGDFVDFGGRVTSGFAKSPTEPYDRYTKLLADWCNSAYSHPKPCAVLAYVQKKTLMRDLIQHKILHVDDKGKLLSKDQIARGKGTKDIFSLVDLQDSAVVRWVVEIAGDVESRTWCDNTLWDSWINYYLNSKDKKYQGVCLVSGKIQILTNNHPKYIRREGDNAKLISSNDTSGFTFRGRFITDMQACGVGLETSQKAHYALAWLISRQGYLGGDLAVVAWAVSGANVPQPTEDSYELLYKDLASEQNQPIADTAQQVGLALRKKIEGYKQEIGERGDVVVMAVDSATPGRLAVIYYRALKGSEFLERIETWHETCAWRHTYHWVNRQDEKGKAGKYPVPFIGAPAPADIAEAAYGSRLDDKLKKATIKRLIPCIVDAQPIPRDLVESAVRRASNRVGLSDYDWNKTLTIACALYRKHKHGKENYDMSLDENRKTRDYLYGRLLAIADVLEERALYKAKEKRATNAARHMQQFSQRPYQTWKQIHEALTPYMIRLGGAHYYKNLIAQVINLNPGALEGNKPLTGEYLLGYYCQYQKLREKSEDSAVEENDDTTSNE